MTKRILSLVIVFAMVFSFAANSFAYCGSCGVGDHDAESGAATEETVSSDESTADTEKAGIDEGGEEFQPDFFDVDE